jgi:predicted P-loop ATPase
LKKADEQIAASPPHLKHDKEINLAMASRKTATDWKNRTMTWSEFLQRLSTPTRTQETAAEYKIMPKSEKDAAKDVGGFVGGFLKGGRRKADAVQSRSLLTLDADHLTMNIWESVPLLFEHAAAVYSTHSHTPEKPRERLIIPLSRPVTPDEYEPIARKVAEIFGLNLFDDTTYQASRLMYWPSCPRDGEYIFEYQDEDFLDPNTILAKYEDWTDISSWPTSERENAVKIHERKKAGDPAAKPGIIGAFCRVYDMASAIETFLPDVYAPTRGSNRYSFIGGSTSGGLVLYDNLFAYSNHATDPTGGKLTNAFDLVRIHKFGDLDEEVKALTPVNRLPSFKAMTDFAEQDKRVSFEVKRASLAEINDDFADTTAGNDSSAWIENLRTAGKGSDRKVLNSIYNAQLILENDPHLKDLIGLNEFTGSLTKIRKPSWEERFDPAWSDSDVSHIRAMIDSRYQVTISAPNLNDAIVTEGKKHAFHPVKDYIERETWDGVKRIATLFSEYLGVEDSPYNREVSELFFGAAVSRIYRPGCKFDYVIVLIGSQGLGKSTLLQKLAPDFFTDSLTSMESKDDMQLLQSSWILEISELSATKRTDIEKQKGFISRLEDVFRPAYAKNPVRVKRHVVFAGTTNEFQFLKDSSGNRRWLPLNGDKDKQVKSVFDRSLEEIIPQVWAEAKHLYETTFKKGKYLDLSVETKALALEKQKDAEAEDPLKDDLEIYLDIQLPTDWYEKGANEKREYIQRELAGEADPFGIEPGEMMQRTKITTREVMAELLDFRIGSADLRQNGTAKKIGMLLNAMTGWERKTIRFPNEEKTMRGYQRKDV